MRAYRALLVLYPRAFREEYGEDMAQLLAQQLRDEGTTRVWARTLLDLALTVPSLHLEVRMSRTSTAPMVYGAGALACLLVLVLGGTSRGTALSGLAGVLVLGSLAVVSWRRSVTLGAAPAGSHWWRYLAAGGTGLGLTVGLANLGDELPDGTWYVFMAALLTSVVLLVVGAALGVAQAAASRRAA
jgi:hypothetical protein